MSFKKETKIIRNVQNNDSNESRNTTALKSFHFNSLCSIVVKSEEQIQQSDHHTTHKNFYTPEQPLEDFQNVLNLRNLRDITQMLHT